MGLTSDIIGIVIKSVFANKIQSEVGNELFGATIDGSLEKSVNIIYGFIHSETLKIKEALSRENLKLMNISEDRVDFVRKEIEELLLKVKITEDVFKQCKYIDICLEEYLWKEYNRSKNGYIEYESDMKKGFSVIAKALIHLEKERDHFEKKLLLDINGSVTHIDEELKVISAYLKDKFENFAQNNQEILELLPIILKQIQNMSYHNQKKIVSRTSQYRDIWNKNMFLNNFSEWDENAGINVKLKEVYLESHLPHFIWGRNKASSINLKNFLSQYMSIHNKQMLLVLGQPGIGKSTLITWMIANNRNMIDKILVYQFASDLKEIKWENTNSTCDISNEIIKVLNLSYEDLENKILILDGFDEINVGIDRVKVINQLYRKFKESTLKNFSFIITCRENYFQDLNKVECDYITLQTWDKEQIKSFCKVYIEKTNGIISDKTMNNILKNNEILGIPLILYMILALNISIDKEGSIVDVYDKIFSLEGGIYDRCIENSSFANFHRIGKIKKQIHQVTREIAMWIFENNSQKAYILKEEYEKICNKVIQEQIENENNKKDFMIGNYFKLVKHCEGIGTEELYFVHRSIYEYFVVEYIYNRIGKVINKKKEDLAKELGRMLKSGYLSEEICKFLKYKIENGELKEKFDIVNETFQLMLQNGMTYYVNKRYKNIIECEMNVFENMLEFIHLWENCNIRFDNSINQYLIYNRKPKLNFVKVDLSAVDLIGVNLVRANLTKANLKVTDFVVANLKYANLTEANLKYAILTKANLTEANLTGANLIQAVLRGADLTKANLTRADLTGSLWYKNDIPKILEQLKEADFTYIIVEEQGKEKRLYRNELF